jgi:hypothetical protein
MNMTIYVHELAVGMQVLNSGLGQGTVTNIQGFSSTATDEPDYFVIALAQVRGGTLVGLLVPQETVDVETIDNGLNDPITDIQ